MRIIKHLTPYGETNSGKKLIKNATKGNILNVVKKPYPQIKSCVFLTGILNQKSGQMAKIR